MKAFLIAIIIAAALGSPTRSHSAENKWNSLDLAIRGGLGEQLTNMAQARAIMETNDLVRGMSDTQLIQLCGQTNYFLTGIVALSLLQERAPGLAFQAALRIVASPDVPVSAQVFFWPAVSNQIDQTTFNGGFTALLQDAATSNENLSLLIRVLPYENLWGWFNTAKPEWTLLSKESMAFVHAATEGARRGRKLTERMKERLNEYRRLPGTVKIAYLMCADESESGYRDTMIEALSDETIPEFRLYDVVRVHARYIRTNVDIELLKISGIRKATIEKVLRWEAQIRKETNQP